MPGGLPHTKVSWAGLWWRTSALPRGKAYSAFLIAGTVSPGKGYRHLQEWGVLTPIALLSQLCGGVAALPAVCWREEAIDNTTWLLSLTGSISSWFDAQLTSPLW